MRVWSTTVLIFSALLALVMARPGPEYGEAAVDNELLDNLLQYLMKATKTMDDSSESVTNLVCTHSQSEYVYYYHAYMHKLSILHALS